MHSCFKEEIIVIMMSRCHVLNAKWFGMFEMCVGMIGNECLGSGEKFRRAELNLVLYRRGPKRRGCAL